MTPTIPSRITTPAAMAILLIPTRRLAAGAYR
jgi:hypothetical protein